MISIDTVYQKVLALANKEQRGYITPQEYNLFADHAQMEIFEQYFYDLDQRQRGAGNQLDYGDSQENLEEKIGLFELFDQSMQASTSGIVNLSSLPRFYRLGMVRVKYNDEAKPSHADQIQLAEITKYDNSPKARWTKKNPVFTKHGLNSITIYPNTSQANEMALISYIRRPEKPNWAYVISGENALYNPSNSINFELHPSEENSLVIKILYLAGVAIKDFQLAQVAEQREVGITQQQKQ
jgi:hypothetical protein